MKRIFTLFFLLPNLFLYVISPKEHVPFSMYAQTNNLELYPKLQSFITPSPQATALTRYGDYPVNYNTGLVDMRIPIYNVKSGSLNLPIDISFHASGRMANETNGVLGMRWVLNVGGVITRTVKGYPDEWENLTSYTVNPNHTPDYDELRRACIQGFIAWENINPNYTKTDSEFDIFNYVLPSGKSGKFILKNENGVKKPLQIPYEALKIELEQDNNYYGHYGAIKITDTDGTIYNYGDGNAHTSSYCEHHDTDDIPGKLGSTPTGWYLKSMISADRKDSINFSYTINRIIDVKTTSIITVSDRFRNMVSAAGNDVERDFLNPYDPINPDWYFDLFGYDLFNSLKLENFAINEPPYYSNDNVMIVPVLKSIKFKEGELNFNYTGLYPSPPGMTTLQDIILTGSDYKKFKFNQEIKQFEKDLRYLNSLEIFSFSNSLEKLEENYIFNYYQPSNPDLTYSVYESSIKRDWWGYYNDNPNTLSFNSITGSINPNLIKYQTIPFVNFVTSSQLLITRNIGSTRTTREPNLGMIELGMLKSITYPTGGKTEFNFESNLYREFNHSSQTYYNKMGPGLRIKKVINKPINGENKVKIFKYGVNENGGGYINPDLKPNKHNVQDLSAMVYWDYGSPSGMGFFFPQQLGYRIRTYFGDPNINASDFGGNIVWYDSVTEYSEDDQVTNNLGDYNNALNGKIIYEYDKKSFDTKQFEINDREFSIDYPKVFADPSNLWTGGKLLAKTIYKKQGFFLVPILKEDYNYTNIKQEEVWDMPIYRHVNFSFNEMADPYGQSASRYNKEKNYHNETCSVFGYGLRKYVSGSEKISSKTVEHYDGNGISSTTEYFYDPQYNQLKKEVVTRSDGKKNSIEYEYVFEKTTLPLSNMGNVYNNMLSKNMISVPVSQSQFLINGNSNTFIQRKRTEFSEPFTDVIRPQTEYFKKGSSTEQAIISYDKYDANGNPEEVSQSDGIHVVYVWGYDKTQPIAKIENATYLAGKPNTITASQQTLLNDAISASINETTELTESALIAKLQLLRNGFPDAMVSTYTYDPLIGITSMTDAKNYTVYYRYDGFGRLKEVKDKEGKIISANKYHYKGL